MICYGLNLLYLLCIFEIKLFQQFFKKIPGFPTGEFVRIKGRIDDLLLRDEIKQSEKASCYWIAKIDSEYSIAGQKLMKVKQAAQNANDQKLILQIDNFLKPLLINDSIYMVNRFCIGDPASDTLVGNRQELEQNLKDFREAIK